MTEGAAVLEMLDAIRKQGQRELGLPPIGSATRPYVVVVPKWYENMCIEQGTTPQQVADETFRVVVRVEVLEGLK